MTLRVAFPFVGDSIGGSHVSTALLMQSLPSEGFAPVAVLHTHGPLHEWLRGQGVETVVSGLPYLESSGGVNAVVRIATMAPRLSAFIRRNGFSLVHANDGRMIATWMPAARVAGRTGIAHRRTRWNASRLARLTLRLARGLIAVSDYVRDGLPPELRQRAIVVKNPFSASTLPRAEMRRAAVALAGSDGPLVGFVGTLQEQKRPAVFLRAAAIIRRQHRAARFLVIGRDGELGDGMRSLCMELGLAGVTTFVGFRADAPALLGGCDLLLAPAVNEGHGRALIESMMAGVPVVAARSGGHMEAVEHEQTGLLVTPDDPDALAQAALLLLGEPDRARGLAAAARAWAVAEFSLAAHAAAVAAVYRRHLA